MACDEPGRKPETELWIDALCRSDCRKSLTVAVSRKGAKRQRRKGEKEVSVDLCFKLHKQYGPGLFESVYEELFCYEWGKNGIPLKRQCGIPLIHEEIRMDAVFRADVIIDDKVLVELKSVEAIADIHYKQVQTYLKLTGLKLGLLINFNVPLIKNGIHRIVNKL